MYSPHHKTQALPDGHSRKNSSSTFPPSPFPTSRTSPKFSSVNRHCPNQIFPNFFTCSNIYLTNIIDIRQINRFLYQHKQSKKIASNSLETLQLQRLSGHFIYCNLPSHHLQPHRITTNHWKTKNIKSHVAYP